MSPLSASPSPSPSLPIQGLGGTAMASLSTLLQDFSCGAGSRSLPPDLDCPLTYTLPQLCALARSPLPEGQLHIVCSSPPAPLGPSPLTSPRPLEVLLLGPGIPFPHCPNKDLIQPTERNGHGRQGKQTGFPYNQLRGKVRTAAHCPHCPSLLGAFPSFHASEKVASDDV